MLRPKPGRRRAPGPGRRRTRQRRRPRRRRSQRPRSPTPPRRRPARRRRPAPSAGPTRPPRWPRSSGWTSSSARAAPGSARRSPSWSSSSTRRATSARSSRATGCPAPIRNVRRRRRAGRATRQARARPRSTPSWPSFNAPSASLVVYEAPNDNDAQALDLFNRIASDDTAQVVTTSWGNCEAVTAGERLSRRRTRSSPRMAAAGADDDRGLGRLGLGGLLPGQRIHRASAVDDPGSQPDVVSAGGTTLSSASASSQVVWNCQVLCQRLTGRGRRRLLAASGRATPGRPSPAASRQGTPIRAAAHARAAGPCPTSPTRPTRGTGRWSPTSTASLGRLRRHQRRRADQRRALRRHQPGLLQPPRPGRPGPLRSGERRQLHRHHVGEQRLHRHQRRRLPGRPPATTPPAAWARPSTRTSPSRCRAPTGARRWRR